MKNEILDKTISVLHTILNELQDGHAESLLRDFNMTYYLIDHASVDRLWRINPSKLESEVKDNFLTAGDTGLQDRYASYVLENLMTYIRPLIKLAKKESEKYTLESIQPIPQARNERTDHQNHVMGWISNYGMLYEQVSDIEASVADLLKHFAPRQYESYYQKYGVSEDALFRLAKPVDLSHTELTLNEPTVKLQWNCKPSIAGYIISELIRTGFIEPPTTNGELSYAKLGQICNQLFSFANHTPSPDSWRKVLNPVNNTLPDYKRVKLKLPECDDVNS